MIVQISLSGNLFVFRKNPSLQPLQKNVFLSSPSCVFYRSKKVFLKKSHSKKLFSWRKTKLLLSPLDFCSIFILSKNSCLFFSCPLFIFLRLSCYLFFLLFLFVFSGVCFSKQKKVKQISFEKIWDFFFFQTFSFELFFRGGNIHILIQKRMCSKIIIRICFKKKSPLKKKKLISRFTRVEDRVREWRPSWPLLRVVPLLSE